jgi:hypothetical protein
MTKPEEVSEFYRIWGVISVRAWSDKKFKERLMKHPKEVLKEFKIEIPEYYKDVKIADHTNDRTIYLNLLAPPPELTLTDEQLKEITAGAAVEGMHC